MNKNEASLHRSQSTSQGVRLAQAIEACLYAQFPYILRDAPVASLSCAAAVAVEAEVERLLMVSDEMVERAARAANLDAGRQRGLAFEDDWEDITEQERGGWRLCVRAALEAALNPKEDTDG